MTQRNPLQAALDRVEPVRHERVHFTQGALAADSTPAKRKASREGTVLIGGHFPPEVKQRLRMIAAEEDTTSQALLKEALDLLFIKKGKQAIR